MSRYMAMSLLVFVILSSCSEDVSMKDIAKSTERIEISKLGINGEPKSIEKVVVVEKPQEIERLLHSVGNSEAPLMKCGHDYELACYQKDGSSFLIEVNSDELCRVAVFNYANEPQFRYYSQEGLAHIETLFAAAH